MKNFRPHKPTSAEDDKALILGSLHEGFCNRNQCASCKFYKCKADCKILFAVQYMQKEQEQCNK